MLQPQMNIQPRFHLAKFDFSFMSQEVLYRVSLTVKVVLSFYKIFSQNDL